MKSFCFKAILQNSGWLENAIVTINEAGKIISVSQSQNEATNAEFINGYALPGFQNAHSHAFQYAMAGLTENHSGDDDFWSWREKMYQLAQELDPESLRIIAQMLYTDLVRNGYSNVAEFHYIHHDRNGVPYAKPAEMGEALVKAARDAGIKITLIPIFYQNGGFGMGPNQRQRRFISGSFEDYKRLFEASVEVCRRYDHADVAVGVHSMRGVDAADIVRAAMELPADIPFHIHVSEQIREVEDALAFLGKRPVEWMLENIRMNERFHLVHATHLTSSEIAGLAKTHANVVLCPSTEGNLGDGLFPLREYQDNGGNWSIGTDSHVGLNPLEELRLLDYGQRIISHKRNTFGGDAGLAAIAKATVCGRRAMNNYETGFFAPGADFDACVIDASAPLLASVKMENLASSILYSADASHFYGTFVAGKLMRKDSSYELIRQKFVDCIASFR